MKSAIPYSPHEYQRDAISFALDRLLWQGENGVGMFLDPGLGKTSITLSLIKAMRAAGRLGQVLIIAPLRVVHSVWPAECQKWRPFNGLKCSIVHGSQSKRVTAMRKNADIYLINPEATQWLTTWIRETKSIPWDMLVIDESSKFKNHGSKRFKALKPLITQFKYRVILTGTPSPNSLMDLYPQVFLLDQGQALGKNITAYRNNFFRQGGFRGYSWEIAGEDSADQIHEAISPLVLRLSAQDHLDLPPIVYNDLRLDLTADVAAKYRKLERELFLELDHLDSEILVGNSGAKYMACRSVANGGIYEKVSDKDRVTHQVHDSKTDALMELIGELQGKPLLVAYQFNHDLERIQKKLKNAPTINGRTPADQTNGIIEKWNAGKIPVLLVQPQALSHGVNMQSAGNDIAWYGLTDNLETYLQFNARIHRQGVTGQVRIHHIIANDTVDEAILDRLNDKDASQQALLRALQKYRERSEEA